MQEKIDGLQAEEKACQLLRLKGYRIIARNVRSRFGEIDIIAKEKNVVCFIEVKARRMNASYSPAETIDYKKRQKLRISAKQYLAGKLFENARFDVLEIGIAKQLLCYNHIKNAFLINEEL